MNFIIQQAFDNALSYLSERVDAEDMPAVTKLLNEAMDAYDDGELNDVKVEALVNQLLPLVRPESQSEVRQLFESNRRLISSYLR
ncbi:MAG: hypothetical protein FWC86_04160 [Coriobacteriia bacterium]|nr:hypothetical protein [Coriobacteriia bacterium]